MVVSVKRQAAAPSQGTPDKPQPKKVAKVPAAAVAPTTFLVMLGNDCQRYFTAGQLYEAGRKYEVNASQRSVLFREVDDNGVRYFYDAAVIERQIAASKARQRKMAVDAGEGEVDTGIVRLSGAGGEKVGVRGPVEADVEVDDSGDAEVDTGDDAVTV